MKSIIKRFIKRTSNLFPKKVVAVNTVTLPQSDWLQGRCALVTGGTSGIGYSIAEAYLKAGASVIITGRSKSRIDVAIEQLNKTNADGIVLGFELDNTKVDTFDAIFQQMLNQTKAQGIPTIDILVNNAGVNFKGMPNAVESEYDLVLDTNLKGAFFLSQLFGKYLVANKIKGNILNIASASSLRPADSAYTVSKWGLRGLTLGLAKALGKDGITVNGIAPGPTATPMMIKDGNTNMALERIPLGRYIMPEEIANMAVVLVSNMGRSIMGDIVYMTGGAGVLTYDDVSYSF